MDNSLPITHRFTLRFYIGPRVIVGGIDRRTSPTGLVLELSWLGMQCQCPPKSTTTHSI